MKMIAYIFSLILFACENPGDELPTESPKEMTNCEALEPLSEETESCLSEDILEKSAGEMAQQFRLCEVNEADIKSLICGLRN